MSHRGIQDALKPQLSASVMQKEFQELANEVAAKIKAQEAATKVQEEKEKKQPEKGKKQPDFIAEKYKVKKFIVLTDAGKRVEAWVYDEKSVLAPILEDQARKRVQSFAAAARELFKNVLNNKIKIRLDSGNVVGEGEKLDSKVPVVELTVDDYLKELPVVFWNKIISDDIQKAKSPIDLIDNEIKEVLKRLGKVCKQVLPKENAMQENFSHLLLEQAELPPFADYRTSDIFTMDLKEGTTQYYQRGTQPLAGGRREYKPTKLEFRSAHHRDGEGVANFAACGKGFIDKDGHPVIVDTSFRHSSLPPIDLYKRKNVSPAETVDITTRNMQHLADEAQLRMTVTAQPEQKVSESKEAKTSLYLMNVGLITVAASSGVRSVFDTDKQNRQFNETILSADRIRFRDDKMFIPITHNFGVNALAQEGRVYPPEQKFENQRAFVQTQQLFFDSMAKLERENKIDELKPLLASISGLAERSAAWRKSFEDKIESEIKPLAKAYDEAVKKSPDEAKKARKNLEKKKAALYNEANNQVEEYKKQLFPLWMSMRSLLLEQTIKTAESKSTTLVQQETVGLEFVEIQKMKKKKLEALKVALAEQPEDKGIKDSLFRLELDGALEVEASKLQTTLARLDPTTDTVKINAITNTFYAVEDFFNYQRLFLTDEWSKKENLFQIQAHLHSLANRLSQLQVATVVASKNCKSGNDRTYLADVYDDQLRHQRHRAQEKRQICLVDELPRLKVNLARHCVTHAASFQTPIDTDGGGSKPGKVRHPNPKFRKQQTATSDWAGHKLVKGKSKHPKKGSTLTTHEVAELKGKRESKTEIESKAEMNLNEAFAALMLQTVQFILDFKTQFSENAKCMVFEEPLYEFKGFLDKNAVDLCDLAKFSHMKNELKKATDKLNASLQTLDPLVKAEFDAFKAQIDLSQEQWKQIALNKLYCAPYTQSHEHWFETFKDKNATLKTRVDEVKDHITNDPASWEKEIHRGFKLLDKSSWKRGDETKAVVEAFNSYLAKNSNIPSERLNDAAMVIQKVDAFLASKEKKPEKQLEKDGSLRKDSRVPAMLALREKMLQEMEKLAPPVKKEVAEVRKEVSSISPTTRRST